MLKAKTPDLLIAAPGLYVDPFINKDIEPGERYLRLNAEGLAKLGLGPEQLKQVKRLDYCKFVVIHKLTPKTYLLRLSSWESHLQKVRDEPEFWEEPETKRLWRLARMAI